MTIKTAISLDEELFAQVESLAAALEVSRSRVFTLAMREFIQRHEDRALLNTLNEVYSDAQPDSEALHRLRKGRHRDMVEGQW